MEAAYAEAEAGGVAQWCQDEAGPYQAIPQPGEAWHPAGHPTARPHEYVRGGTAKLLTLFRPATGEGRAQGVLSAPNAVLHPWLKDHLSQPLAHLEAQPAPFVWDGKRRRRRERARMRRHALGGSGAAVMDGYSIVT